MFVIHWGYKDAKSTFRIHAMYGEPIHINRFSGVSKRFSLEIGSNYDGFLMACVNLESIWLAAIPALRYGSYAQIYCVGEGETKRITYRNGAKENDLICVSGDLGQLHGMAIAGKRKNGF
jgi:thiamine-monophosphate kinase